MYQFIHTQIELHSHSQIPTFYQISVYSISIEFYLYNVHYNASPKSTKEFIETMHSLSLYPKITRPSRITQSATLKDNIFTNLTENKTISGLFINAISDHLPIFVVYDSYYKKYKQDIGQQFKRVTTEEIINAFKKELIKLNGESVFNQNNVDKAHETFLYAFKLLYDRNCPIKKCIKINKYSDTL